MLLRQLARAAWFCSGSSPSGARSSAPSSLTPTPATALDLMSPPSLQTLSVWPSVKLPPHPPNLHRPSDVLAPGSVSILLKPKEKLSFSSLLPPAAASLSSSAMLVSRRGVAFLLLTFFNHTSHLKLDLLNRCSAGLLIFRTHPSIFSISASFFLFLLNYIFLFIKEHTVIPEKEILV